MTLGDYVLLSPRSVGPDGTSYRAYAKADGKAVEVRVLSQAEDSSRSWSVLRKRIHTNRLLDNRGALEVFAFHDVHEPPFVVLEYLESRSLEESFIDRLPLAESEAVGLTLSLATAVAKAHQFGLAHGGIDPRSVKHTLGGRAFLDFSGIDVGEPPPTSAEAPDDVKGLGRILRWLLVAQDSTRHEPALEHRHEETCVFQSDDDPGVADPVVALEVLVRDMMASEPMVRPSARQVVARLEAIRGMMESAAHGETTDSSLSQGSAIAQKSRGARSSQTEERVERVTLGRYRLLEKLGQGGMGSVFRGEDLADGTIVAIKVLKPEWADRPGALPRFRKEARLLAEVNNPYVTNFLEVNEDDGIHYLVLEYVSGINLGQLLEQKKMLPEGESLAILADVARALVDAHERGIVHRDIKPDNILLSRANETAAYTVKLSDFGLARHVIESESLQVTQAQAVVGTPQYMAPEQGVGGTIDPRTDIYAMGVTLYRMLSGTLPFTATRLMDLIAKHCNEPPPPIRKINPLISDGAARIVEKALSKAPEMRYPDAAAILAEIDRLLRGEPTADAVLPKFPETDPRDLLEYDFAWDLEASPRQLWPMVTNTERLNRAIGMPAVEFRTETDSVSGKSRRFGTAKQGGIAAEWEEHPFEWVEPRRMGVLREYRRGPFKWMLSSLELTPRPQGGTTLIHHLRIAPRGVLMRAAAQLKVGRDTKKALERVYRRIDSSLMGKLGDNGLVDPFEEPAPLSQSRRRRLERLLGGLSQHGVHPSVVEKLGEFLATAPAQEVTRIRPYALARRLGLDASQVITACLHGARDGLLILMWDLLCPLCRIPSEVKDTLRLLSDHGHCEACNLDYTLDFANSVEMIFRVHPEVRDAELGVYCIGGPSHSPHVVAQVRIAAGARIELDLGLSEGSYQIRGPRLPFAFGFRVEPSTGSRRLELDLKTGPERDEIRSLRAGGQSFLMNNPFGDELIVRIERTASRDDALTAARASSLALFRDLFPAEILSPGQLISIATTTLLMTALDDSDVLYAEKGDAGAFAIMRELFHSLEERIRAEGGALVKTVGEGVLASFPDSASAVRVALSLGEVLGSNALTIHLSAKAAVHRGPAMAATINDHLDYFGLTVAQTSALLHHAARGETMLSQAVMSEPAVMAALRARRREVETETIALPAAPSAIVHRLRP